MQTATQKTPAERQARRTYRQWKTAQRKEADTRKRTKAEHRYRAALKAATPAYVEG